MKKLLCLALCLLLLAGCSQAEPESEVEYVGGSTRRDPVSSTEPQFTYPEPGAPIAVIETSKGAIRVVLFPQYAPLAVENFCSLAQLGYYDGTDFHRVVRDFVIQGGDATGTGTGGHSIWGGAPIETEYTDKLHHYSGALCLAAADGAPNTHLSQFYIVATPQNGLDEAALQKLQAAGVREDVVETYRKAGGAPYLDYTATVFGQVLDGMDVVDNIARVSVEEDGRPKTAVRVERITIENYPPQGAASQPSPASQPTVTSPPASDPAPDSLSGTPE